jgi:lipopolysaccharide biosynthesis glycosyltransferase
VPAIIHYALPEKPWIYSNARAAYAWPYKFGASLWYNYYLKSPLEGDRLKRKRIGLLSIFWHHLKPLLKQNHFLLELWRHFMKIKYSPICDFFD